jgi:hypothetical protein
MFTPRNYQFSTYPKNLFREKIVPLELFHAEQKICTNLHEEGNQVNPIKRQIMFEKVNPSHPDKVADRIAGAIVDLCYTKSRNPKVALSTD